MRGEKGRGEEKREEKKKKRKEALPGSVQISPLLAPAGSVQTQGLIPQQRSPNPLARRQQAKVDLSGKPPPHTPTSPLPSPRSTSTSLCDSTCHGVLSLLTCQPSLWALSHFSPHPYASWLQRHIGPEGAFKVYWMSALKGHVFPGRMLSRIRYYLILKRSS